MRYNMKQFDIFIKQGKNKYIFNGYAYEQKNGYINMEINTIPFKKKFILIKSENLFKVAS